MKLMKKHESHVISHFNSKRKKVLCLIVILLITETPLFANLEKSTCSVTEETAVINTNPTCQYC